MRALTFLAKVVAIVFVLLFFLAVLVFIDRILSLIITVDNDLHSVANSTSGVNITVVRNTSNIPSFGGSMESLLIWISPVIIVVVILVVVAWFAHVRRR